jgi:hypothetical protein
MKEHSIRQMANELAISQASQQDPWRLVSTSERKISRPQTLDEKTTNRSVLSMTNELKYSSYSGLSGSLRSRHSYTDTDNQKFQTQIGVVEQDSIVKSHELTGSIQYDVLKGFFKEEGKFQRNINQLSASKSNSDNSLSFFNKQKTVFSNLVNILAISCKRTMANKNLNQLSKTVRITEAQLKPNLIPMKDYLNIKNSYIQSKRRLIEFERGLENALGELGATSPESHKLTLEFLQSLTSCNIAIDISIAKAKSSSFRTSGVMKNHPSIKAAELSRKIAKGSLYLSRIDQLPSISPFASSTWSPIIDEGSETGSVSLGIAIDWQIPGQYQSSESREKSLLLKASTESLEISRANLSRQLSLLNKSLLTDIKTASALEEILINARKMFKVSESEVAAGTADSTILTSSYNTLIETHINLIDIWASIENSIFHTTLLKQYEK